ncbi:M20 metallopeptidase family protein [Tomitella gaofuii]|uniref:M20 metallopeptidase family protein n=1 Tax=Tomitella gaofuii TaxID=2760083 RepID=UPI0015F89047|nr:amidohydrolase [Tomitella gaofuii]
MASSDTEALRNRIDVLAAEVERKVIDWRHHLHAHPELSNRETRTAAYVAEHLRALGLDEVRTGIADHGVVGVLRGRRPGHRVMALRADIDALPVKEASGVDFASTVVDEDYPGGPFPVAHSCGHDTHTAMLMGAAEVLSAVRDEVTGTVLFVFQPAEEGPPLDEDGGARAMLAAGALDDPSPSMVFGMHIGPTPLNTVAYRPGVQYAASSVLKITVTGRQVHGSTPWLGVDPMPVAAAIITAMGQLYRQVPATDPLTISIGHVEDVGRFNIIGGTVTLMGTIRCLSPAAMEKVSALVERTVDHLAQAYEASATTELLQPVPAVFNAPEWVDAAIPTLRRVAGEDRVFEVQPNLGYDDVSEFVNKYGGLYVMLGAQDSQFNAEGTGLEPVPGGRGIVPNHNPAFYADDAALVTGVRLHAHTTVEHLAGRLSVEDGG